MRKYGTLIVVFIAIWAFSTGVLYILGQVLDRPTFQNIGYIILLGFSCAFFGIFGPPITDRLKRKK